MEKQSNAYIRNIDRQLISEEDMFLWLSKGDLKAETESEIVTAQDQALQTKYCATKILNTETDSKCRLCQQLEETIDHILSACPILAKEQYCSVCRNGAGPPPNLIPTNTTSKGSYSVSLGSYAATSQITI